MTRQSAIVTGGTAGVGRAVVDRLANAGYDADVFARGSSRLNGLVAVHGPDRIRPAACDVSDADATSAAARVIADDIGPPKVYINCAMLTSFSPFARMAPAVFERIVDATFLGQVKDTRTALKVVDRTGEPVNINVGSGLSYCSVPFESAYCAARHAINGFTSALQSELIREGHPGRLSLVQLPALNTPQFDWARHGFDKQPPARPTDLCP